MSHDFVPLLLNFTLILCNIAPRLTEITTSSLDIASILNEFVSMINENDDYKIYFVGN